MARTAGGSTPKGRRTRIAKQKTSTQRLRRNRSPLAELRKQLERRTNELAEARAQQTATIEVLGVINSSPAELTPVFDSILQKAHALCNVTLGSLQLYDGEYFRVVATHAFSEQFTGLLRDGYRADESFVARSLLKGDRFVQINDAAKADFFLLRAAAKLEGIRTVLFVPLRKENALRGIIVAARREQRLFSDREIRLLENFAAQAVIAIENARLFNETRDSLARQTATSDILRVISQSPTDVKPVFDTIVLAAVRLLQCDRAFVLRCDAVTHSVAAMATLAGLSEGGPQNTPIDPEANFPSRAIVAKQMLHLPDWSQIELPPFERVIQETFGVNSAVFLPLLRGGECIGLIALAGKRPNMFGPNEIALAESFRDQALIAIENTRLFNETREALERQTAMADVLAIINSSAGDLAPVFETILKNAHALCGVTFGSLQIYDGEYIRAVATHGLPDDFVDILRRGYRAAGSPSAGPLLEGQRYSHIADAAKEEFPALRASAELAGIRTVLFIPLRKDNRLLGTIAAGRREVRPFSEKEISLLENFAAQAALAIESVRLFNETNEALERQTATADVLQAISRSTFDLDAILNTLVNRAARLCNAGPAEIFRRDGEVYRYAASRNVDPAYRERERTAVIRPGRGTVIGRAVTEKRAVQILDALEDAEYEDKDSARIADLHTMLAVPLLRDGEPVGAFALARNQVEPFTDSQINLVSTFADQAVIAIENVRLFNETREALERQTATADILKVIASSPTDVGPVLKTIVERACDLCDANDAAVLLKDRDDLCFSAHHGPIAINVEKWPINRGWASGRAVLDRVPVHIADIMSDRGAEYLDSRELSRHSRTAGIRSVLAVPLLQEGNAIGSILLRRLEVRPFTEKQIGLLQTFADQAVIAIQNVKLFEEVQAKTRDLEEALVYQTGSANILKVIASSTTDVAPVLKAIVDSAAEICDAIDAVVVLKDGNDLRFRAHYGNIPLVVEKWPITPKWTAGRAFLEQRPVHVRDLLSAEGEEFPEGRELALQMGHRTILSVPMLRENESIGAIVLRRTEVQPFTEKQIALLQTFADQAVIAIQNVKLFDEVQAKTRDLEESLQQQTATADVLKVISRSAFDLQVVLDTLVESAARLCEAERAFIFQRSEGVYKQAANYGFSREFEEFVRQNPILPNRGTVTGRVALEGRTIHFADVLADPEFTGFQYQSRASFRTSLGVPLLRAGEVIGVFFLSRSEVNPFTEKQIDLVTTFADQAVIAIENVRLFDEVQARTRDLSESLAQQTATADVLKTISRSTFDLNAVLHTLVESAAKLADAEKATITRQREGMFYRAESYGFSQEFMDYVRNVPIIPDRSSATSRALLEGTVVHIPDVKADPEYTFNEAQRLGDFRAVLAVPMLREGTPVGVIVLTRTEPKAFTDKQIELVTTFADQAAIAIENVRLFESVEMRTRELAKSLEELRTAQDRLVQTEKLASLGQLTAGIAHEIKNPLNFVNNFSALSSELVDELLDALKPTELGGNARQEVDELTHMLKGNLDKVVQHGKRADSIVKNMLLHSRSGSGEHRPTEINAIVEESLNLAYHGARAEKSGFNITLQRDFDPDAGLVDVYPQEMTRVLLNLISNGFYAATKRKAEAGDGFEPTLSASTRNLGDKVEIRVRDNGTGIPQAVKEKMFNPFFTTKPAGEGTGLGLSMSHDIVVKQHQGRIEVETQPGAFTEFIITLPRAAALAN